MGTLAVLLKLGLVAYAVYSLIVYAVRRSGNRNAFQQLRAAPVIRSITPEEQAALEPFLVSQPKRRLTIDGNVRELSGPFVRHGLSSNGKDTLHDTLGDVDVLLPYDAIDYMDVDNKALVVLGEKCAVVIRVNGFELLEGRERAQRKQVQDRQWEKGELGSLQDVDVPTANADAPAGAAKAGDAPGDTGTRNEAFDVVVLGQRKETPEEVASRVGRGWAWGSALLWVAAFVLLYLATWDATQVAHRYLVLGGLAMAGGGAWLFLRRPSDAAPLDEPQTVNRVSGQLNLIAVTDASNTATRNVLLFLGDKLNLSLPEGWRDTARLPIGEVFELEARTSDRSVVSLGGKWSVADEWRRFRPVYWGRYLLHCMVGLIASLALLIAGPNLKGEVALVMQWLNSGEHLAYQDARQLRDSPPAWGSYVSVQGAGRCGMAIQHILDADETSSTRRMLPSIDCATMHWGADAPVIPELQIPASIDALANPSLMQGVGGRATAVENMIAMAMLRAQMEKEGEARFDALSAYGLANSLPRVIPDFRRVVTTIERACTELTPGDCDTLQRAVVHAAQASVKKDGVDMPIGTWAELAASAQPGKENASLVVSRSQLSALQAASQKAAARYIAGRIEAALSAVDHGQGGVVLVSASGIGFDLAGPGAGDADESAADSSSPSPDDSASLLSRWHTLQAQATPQAVKPFALTGLVVGRETDASGAPVLRIDPRLNMTRVASAAAYAFWGLMAAGLLLVNGVILVLRLRERSRRNRELQADRKSRPDPSGARGFFHGA